MQHANKSHPVTAVEERRRIVEGYVRQVPPLTNTEIARLTGVNRDLVAKLKKAILAGDPGHDKRVVTVPDGRKFSEVCAEGIQLEESGMTSKETYTKLGLSETAYRAGREREGAVTESSRVHTLVRLLFSSVSPE